MRKIERIRHLRRIASLGGRATFKKHGSKHFSNLAKKSNASRKI